jgi:hypothetical protein
VRADQPETGEGTHIAGKFEIYTDAVGKQRFRLKAVAMSTQLAPP